MAKLTGKQELFCQEYIVDLNATQAAIRAGYSEDTAAVIASENLTKPNIQDRVAELMQDRQTRTQITADNVVKELARLGFMRPEKYFKKDGEDQPIIAMDDLDEDSWAPVKGVTNKTKFFTDKDGQTTETREVKLELADKKAALDSLGRHFGMFTDKVVLQSPDVVDKIFTAVRDELQSRKLFTEEDEMEEFMKCVAKRADG